MTYALADAANKKKAVEQTLIARDGYTIRKCMCCQAPFESQGIHHRLCPKHHSGGGEMLESGSTGRRTLPRGGQS